MANWFRKIVAAPVFPGDAEKSAQARWMHVVGLYYLLGLIITGLIFVPAFATRKIDSWAILLGLLIVYGIARYFLARGKLKTASFLVIGSGWLFFAGVTIVGGGIRSPVMIVIIALTVVIGLLFPPRTANHFFAFSLGGGLALAIYQQLGGGIPQHFSYSPLSTWFFIAVSLLFMNRTMAFVMGSLHKALDDARQQNLAREKAETTLRASETKYRQLHESLRDGFCLVDMTGRIKECNETFLQMVGYDDQALKQLAYWDITPSRWHELEQKIVDEQVIPLGYSHVYEKEYRRKDGTVFPVELRTFLVKDEDGRVQGMATIVRDISERKQAEAGLKAANQRFEGVLDSLDSSIYAVDMATYEILFINSYGRDRWGDIQGKICWQTIQESPGGPCEGCTNPRLVGPDGKPSGQIIISENQDRKTHLWYESRTQAMVWPDGRLVRIEISTGISERKRMEEAEREQRVLAEALSSAAAALNGALDFEEVLNRIMDSVGAVVSHDSVVVLLLDAEGRLAKVVGHRNSSGYPLDMEGHLFQIDQIRNLREMLTTRAPLIIPDVSAYEGWVRVSDDHWIRSYLGAPILFKGNVTGFISLSSDSLDSFSARDAERLQSFAHYAAIAIENARLYTRVQKLALTDTLTGAFNRAYFESELARMQVASEFPVSILVADLDNMKLTNDRFGHAAGDELLKRCTQLLQATFRAGDVLARIGGDEFAVLLPKTDAITTALVLSRIHARLAEQNAQFPDLPVNLSLGTSTAEGGLIMDAFIAADQRMYADKAVHKSRLEAQPFLPGMPPINS